ncbi:hypothetical protein DFH09DRAFT_1474039 [Mycena vulgaris]|nr:hypothetical protein DFH09DRAFT_1474039 [Mycena vulgaris]
MGLPGLTFPLFKLTLLEVSSDSPLNGERTLPTVRALFPAALARAAHTPAVAPKAYPPVPAPRAPLILHSSNERAPECVEGLSFVIPALISIPLPDCLKNEHARASLSDAIGANALCQPMTPPLTAAVTSSLDAPRLWLARILNPALDADSMDTHTHPAPAPAISSADPPPSAPSGRSLRDTQPLPPIGAAFPPVPRLESRRAQDENSSLRAPRALFPSAFTRAAPHQARSRAYQVRSVVGGTAAYSTRGDEAPMPRILHPPPPPPPTPSPLPPAPTIRTRLRPLPAGLRARGVWARPPRAALRPDYRSSGIASDAQALTSTDMYCPRALVAAAEKHSNVFPYTPHAVANHTSRFADAQRENGFAYNPHAFAATDVHDAHGFTTAPMRSTTAASRTPAHAFAATDAHPIGAADAQQDSGFAYNLHAFTNAHTIAADVSCPHPIAGCTYGFAPVRAARTRVRGRSGEGASAATERGDDDEGQITRGLSSPTRIMSIPSPRRAGPGGRRCGRNSSCNVGRGRGGGGLSAYSRRLGRVVWGSAGTMKTPIMRSIQMKPWVTRCTTTALTSLCGTRTNTPRWTADADADIDDMETLHECAAADMQDDAFDGGGFEAEFARGREGGTGKGRESCAISGYWSSNEHGGVASPRTDGASWQRAAHLRADPLLFYLYLISLRFYIFLISLDYSDPRLRFRDDYPCSKGLRKTAPFPVNTTGLVLLDTETIIVPNCLEATLEGRWRAVKLDFGPLALGGVQVFTNAMLLKLSHLPWTSLSLLGMRSRGSKDKHCPYGVGMRPRTLSQPPKHTVCNADGILLSSVAWLAVNMANITVEPPPDQASHHVISEMVWTNAEVFFFNSHQFRDSTPGWTPTSHLNVP